MDSRLKQLVWERAGARCEYCHIPQAAYPSRLHVDHIVARKHHGATIADNLALACLSCNLHKGTNLTGADPLTGQWVSLFNPRVDIWSDHFEWRGPILVGRTPTGRTTIDVLCMNDPDFVAARSAILDAGQTL